MGMFCVFRYIQWWKSVAKKDFKERKQWSRFDSVGFQSFNDPGSIKEMSKSLRLSLHGIG